MRKNNIDLSADCNFGSVVVGEIPTQPQKDREDIFFFGEFSFENLEIFVQDFKASGDRINIHITSNGGAVSVLTSMLHMVNTSKKDIIIVVSGFVASCGFDFILKTNRKIVFTEIATGLVHDMDITCSIKELKKNSKSLEKFMAQEIEKNNTGYYSLLAEHGFTKKEIDVVRRGEDLLLSRDRLIELFKDRIYSEDEVGADGYPFITEYEEELTKHIVSKLLEEIDKLKK